ncbi:MAG TPA: IPT/TIG domain-containing protein [Mycobacteriales bacterium]|nr:IPT/TIG domain-containing protein [Mycobacteriales bacterium]
MPIPFGDFGGDELAVDPSGDAVWMADDGARQILEARNVGAGGWGAATTLDWDNAGGDTFPDAIAADGSGHLYVAQETDAVSSIVELDASNAAYERTVATNLPPQISGLAVDAAGDVFAGESESASGARVVEIPHGMSTPQTLPFGSIGATAGVGVDSAGDVFVADPSAQEIRALAVGSASPVVEPFTDLGTVKGVALDAAGDLFVTDSTDSSRLLELPASSVELTPPPPTTSSPVGVAVDGAGDAFVVDQGNNRVVELPPGSTDLSTATTVPFETLNTPYGVAVDSEGNVFVANTGAGDVLEMPAGGTTAADERTLRFTLLSPFYLAVDSEGDIFAAGYTYNDDHSALIGVVQELPADWTGSSTPQTLGFSGLTIAVGVAVDNAGDVFVADDPVLVGAVDKDARVVELPADGSGQHDLPFSGLQEPLQIASDAAGDVFVADAVSQVIELPAGSSTQKVLSFPTGTYAGVAVDQAGTEVYATDVLADTLNELSLVPPKPVVASVSPSSGSTAGGTSVTVTGTGFTGATAVTFGGTAGTNVVVNSDTSVTVTSPKHAAGAVNVRVTTPAGQSEVVAPADQFSYLAPPKVTSVSPASGPTAGGTSVTVTGSGFTGATAVSFGGTAGTNVVVGSDTSLTVTTPAHAAGAVNVRVTGPGGQSAVAAPADQFTYVAKPKVASISPSSGPKAGGTLVTVTGEGFTPGATVAFGNGAAGTSVTFVSSTELTVVSPAHSSVGSVNVTVTTAGGTSAAVAGDKFSYLAPPKVASVSPASGPAAGGASVTITGAGFTGATAVTFAGVAATNVVVVSDTQITATSPRHAVGSTNVRVTTPVGQSAVVAADRYTYT